MRLRFLGTSAGELYPGLWCRCAHCAAARASGDPRDRRQSATVAVYPDGTDGDPASLTLIDFPGKYRLECWFVTRPAVWNSVNWLRTRAGRPEIERPLI